MIRLDRTLRSGQTAQIRFTDRAHGDFAPDATGVGDRRRGLEQRPWTWLRQVHGPLVVRVDAPGDGAGAEADGSITARDDVVLAVCTADCAPVVLLGSHTIGSVHVGWRGAVGGVLEAAVDELRVGGDEPRSAIIGPCIRPHAYEFGVEDLELIADHLGPAVRARTVDDEPALDLAAAVRAALGNQIDDVVDLGHDTAEDRWFSNRVRGDRGRQVTAVWLES